MAKGNRTDGTRTALQLFLYNGTLSSTTFFAQAQNITVSNDEYELFQITGTVPDDAENITVRLYIYTSNVINIKYVKLEVGNIATPLSPRPYAEELADCQRYYQIIPDQTVLQDSYHDTTSIDFIYYLPVIMRTTPTISSMTGGYVIREISATAVTNVTGFTISNGNALSNRYFHIKATKNPLGITSNHCVLRLNGKDVTLDAEYYS